MKCLRFDFHKKFPLFIQGRLDLESVRKIEDHLVQCEECRAELSNVMKADQLVRNLPRIAAANDSWEKLQPQLKRSVRILPAPTPRLAMLASAAAALAIVTFFAFFLRMPHFGTQKLQTKFDPSRYQQVALSKFSDAEEPHVTTVGYVSDIQVDEEEGDLMFKLVDDLHRPTHFVVCEIIAPIKLNVPAPGSRIRVYGVSRYDAQADHQWFEVHPVVSIESAR
jgi:hypothetical protein